MLQRILVMILLVMVEFSTVRECFSDCKHQVEVQDIEDNNEPEDTSKEVTLEKYFVESMYFQFDNSHNVLKNVVCDEISTTITNPFRVIDSPPPKR
ncbi:MAG: hypothetical protein U5M51_01310 [Emticicia sp.]|nr:hypothetical protein [Emticicia sp.]